VLNIGGIANITVLPAGGGRVSGFDTGPGNSLLDAWIRAKRNLACDRDGEWAKTGQSDQPLLARLLDDPYFASPPPKSTGFEYFNLRWLEDRLGSSRSRRAVNDEDVQATLVSLTVATIADAVRAHAPATKRVLVCGGGVNNPRLMQGLSRALPEASIESTAALGVAPGWVEAATFAWLAQRRLDGLAGNLPSVTGASAEAVLGAVYYGHRPA
jgi:anhydro-N-acetylmuramic acid kinase